MGIGGGLLFGVLTTWLTPTWLLGVGAALGLLILAVLYGVVRLISAPATAFLHDSFREGFLRPVLLLALILSVLSAFSSLVVPVRDLTRSLIRLPTAGVLDRTAQISADAADQQVDLEMRQRTQDAFDHQQRGPDDPPRAIRHHQGGQRGQDRPYRRRTVEVEPGREREQSVLWRYGDHVGQES